ncbi:MAG: type II secretion system major pseudopilin GspG [Planctomycetaceae bacterium]|nr:type II secretion system major pseudopilin GspG [Planctomycetaceae bacterium]
MHRSTRQTKRPSLRHGFTLTELLIVMAILVLLVSMVGPRLLGSKKKADINAAKTQIGMFQAALERYAIDVNTFPNTEEGLDALVSEPGDSEGGDSESEGRSSSWDGPYLKQNTLPLDPWGNSYGYEFPPKHSKGDQPEIWSFGPDGEDDTDDDILSWTGGRDGEADGEDGGSFDDDRSSAETTSTFGDE